MKDDSLFLLDANALITPYNQYYAFDLVPSFWKALSKQIKTKRIALLDVARNEINNEELSDWIVKQEELIIFNHIEAKVIEEYRRVMQYVNDCGLYLKSAFDLWAQEKVADPWLIAAASVNQFVIITTEVPSGGLGINNPNKEAKIPDVAKAFDVECRDVFSFMRALGIRI